MGGTGGRGDAAGAIRKPRASATYVGNGLRRIKRPRAKGSGNQGDEGGGG